MVRGVFPTSLVHRAFLLLPDNLITTVDDIPIVNDG